MFRRSGYRPGPHQVRGGSIGGHPLVGNVVQNRAPGIARVPGTGHSGGVCYSFLGDSSPRRGRMARRTRDALEYDEDDAGASLLARSLMWGGLAIVALGGAALSGQTESGAQRLAALMQG